MQDWKIKLGIILIILSLVTVGLLFLLPFMHFSTTQNITYTTAIIILGEVFFWSGSLLVGKELFTKYKSYLHPKNWFKNKKSLDINSTFDTEFVPHWQPSHLENELVKLVPIQETDFETLYGAASDPAIWEHHPSPNRYQKPEFKLFFDAALASKSAFMVLDKLTNNIIGSTRFYDYHPSESVAIGYTFLAKAYWGGKYNASVKKLMLDYAFLYVNRVFFHIGDDNRISHKAVQKLGATFKRAYEFESQGKKLPYVEFEIDKATWESK